jgi:hypothetical protein
MFRGGHELRSILALSNVRFTTTAAFGPTAVEVADSKELGVPGLTLFKRVLEEEPHDRVVHLVDSLLERGRAGELKGNTYSCPGIEWLAKKKSREMLQFGAYTNANRVLPTPGLYSCC